MRMRTAREPRFESGCPCPWGEVQQWSFVAEGIVHVTTAGHGGFLVTRALYDKMPEHLRLCSFTDNQWFEEDCAWCAVVLAFPEHFDARVVRGAQECYDRWFK